MYKIYVGSLTDPLYYFEQATSFGAVSTQRVNLIGQELTIDTFEPVVMDNIDNLVNVRIFRSSDGKEIIVGAGEIYATKINDGVSLSGLIDLEYGTPVWYYYEETLIGKFYYQKTGRPGSNKYKLHCVSVVGLLDKMMHDGGLYPTATFGDILENIMMLNTED